MARRTQILDALVDHLAANTDAVANNVHKRYLYLNDINDFPTITFLPQTERRVQRGGGTQVQRSEPSTLQAPYLSNLYQQAQNLYDTGPQQYFPGATIAQPSQLQMAGEEAAQQAALGS